MNGARRVRVIGAASGIGAQDAACADGPVAFHHAQAWQALARLPALDWGRTLFAPDGERLSRTARIAALCRALADEVEETLRQGWFPLIIGGDHSVAVGTWSGVARAVGQPLGLLWIDAHLDSHTPESSYSGAVHGMPLACLLGQGDRRLVSIGLPGGQLSPGHCAVLGARSYEPEEIDFLRRQGVRIFDGEEITRRGFAACLDEAAGIVGSAPAGFGVSLDLDAIDPRFAPGVGSPEPDGLPPMDVRTAWRWLAGLPGLRGLEIVEYNPDRDRHGMTAQLIADLIGETVAA